MRPTDHHYMSPTAPCGQVFPGLAELHAMADAQAYRPDFTVSNFGTIVILNAHSKRAQAWVNRHLPCDRMTWGHNGTVVEPRYISAILYGIESDGLTTGH